jgi:hypothetical protein
MGRDPQVTVDLMRETAAMIDWTGDDATEDLDSLGEAPSLTFATGGQRSP